MSQLYAGSGHRQWAPPSGPDRRRWTEVVHHTFGAARYAGDTDPAAMQDQPQAEAGPFGSRDQLRHVGFDLDRVRAPGQPKPPREPGDVGVDGKPRDAEGHAQHHIGGLLPTPGKVTRSSIRGGTSPPNRSTRAALQAMIVFALTWKNPVGLMRASTA